MIITQYLKLQFECNISLSKSHNLDWRVFLALRPWHTIYHFSTYFTFLKIKNRIGWSKLIKIVDIMNYQWTRAYCPEGKQNFPLCSNRVITDSKSSHRCIFRFSLIGTNNNLSSQTITIFALKEQKKLRFLSGYFIIISGGGGVEGPRKNGSRSLPIHF